MHNTELDREEVTWNSNTEKGGKY